MKTLQIIYSFLLIVSTTGTLYSSAQAADFDAPRQRTVSFGDLNLDHPEGVATLFGRLRGAARAVCEQASPTSYILWAQSRKCEKQALSKAVEDIDNDNLTAYYNRQTGQPGETKVASRR